MFRYANLYDATKAYPCSLEVAFGRVYGQLVSQVDTLPDTSQQGDLPNFSAKAVWRNLQNSQTISKGFLLIRTSARIRMTRGLQP